MPVVEVMKQTQRGVAQPSRGLVALGTKGPSDTACTGHLLEAQRGPSLLQGYGPIRNPKFSPPLEAMKKRAPALPSPSLAGGAPQTRARSWVSIPTARSATARDPGCPHKPGRTYLRFVARPVLKLRSGAHGLPPVVDHLLAGRAGAPAEASRCGAQRRRGGRRFQERSAPGIPASVPRAGATRASGRACAGVRVRARLCARVCVRVRAGAPEPPACAPSPLPALGSRASAARSSASALLPPSSSISASFFSFLFRTLFAFYCSPVSLRYTRTPHSHSHTAGCGCYIPPPKGQDTREADRALDTRGQREGSKRLGQPSPRWPAEGPENPRGASSKTSSPAGLRPTLRAPGCRTGRVSWAPPPGGRCPQGVARAPPGSQSAAGLTPRPRLGRRRRCWPECAPCGSPRSCSGPKASASGPGVSGYRGPTLGDPTTRGRPWGASQPQSQTCVLALGRAEPAGRLPAQAA